MLIALAILLDGGAFALDSDGEAGALTKTALDYIEGWYAGDAVRMEQRFEIFM